MKGEAEATPFYSPNKIWALAGLCSMMEVPHMLI